MFTKDDILLFTGDSITDCGRNRDDTSSAGHGYANLLRSQFHHDHPHLNLTIYNRGVSGNRVVDLYARAKEDCYNLRPNILSVLIGVNDVWHEFFRGQGVEAEKFHKIYDLFLTETRERLPNVKFVLMEPFVLEGGLPIGDYASWRSELATRQRIVQDLTVAHNTVFVPLQAEFDAACAKASDTYWLYDGVHPTAAGHMLIAHTWQKAVIE